MIDGTSALALQFLQSQPREAARQLESLEPEQLALFMTAFADQLQPQFLSFLLPHYMGQVCSHLEAATTAELIGKQDASYVAAVLRFLPKKKQNAILGHMAPTKRASVLLLLNFGESEVGSWMNPTVATLPDDGDIESARRYLKLGHSQVESDRLFVVDRGRSLVGHVSQIELVRARKKAPLRELMVPTNEALLARMPVQTAIEHPAWSEADVMPVNNRQGNFVGAIRHVELRKAAEQLGQTGQMPAAESPLQGLASAYGNTFFTLFGAVEDIFRDSTGRDSRGGRK